MPLRQRHGRTSLPASGCCVRLPQVLSALVTFALVCPAAVFAALVSDRLTVIDKDLEHYVAQQTIASDGPSLTYDLPAGATYLHSEFIGPEAGTFRQFHNHRKERLSIWSGSALVRYRHRFGASLEPRGDDRYTLTLRSPADGFSVDDEARINASSTWVFPESVHIESFRASGGNGTWHRNGNSLSYVHRSDEPATIAIDVRLQPPPQSDQTTTQATEETTTPLPSSAAGDEHCSSQATPRDCRNDLDRDGVADEVDVCLFDTRDKAAADSTATDATTPGTTAGDVDTDALEFAALLGCAGWQPVALDEIRFPEDRSYLDIAARRQLDRLAKASKTFPEGTVLEIGAHTDARGPADYNRELSRQRAESIRHYLMLRGLDPNQVLARGYGEGQPRAGTADSTDRHTNRRVEIRLLPARNPE